MVFYFIGGISLVYGLCCQWLIYNSLESHPRITEREHCYLKSGNTHAKITSIPWKNILKSVPINAFFLTHICHTFGIIVLTLLLPRFLNETMRFSLKETGIYSSAPFAGSCLSKVITVASCKAFQTKFNENLTLFRRCIYAGCNFLTIALLTFIIILDCSHKFLVVLSILLIGMTTDIAFSGAYWISLLDCAPAFAGLLSGISNSFATLVGSLAPLGISKIIILGSKSEWNMVFLSMICGYFFSAIVYGLWGSSDTQAWSKPTRPFTDTAVNT